MKLIFMICSLLSNDWSARSRKGTRQCTACAEPGDFARLPCRQIPARSYHRRSVLVRLKTRCNRVGLGSSTPPCELLSRSSFDFPRALEVTKYLSSLAIPHQSNYNFQRLC